MPQTDTDLPFGDAFSPAQLAVDSDEDALAVVLEMVAEFEGRPDAFDEAVAERFFQESPEPLTRAKNVRLGLQTDSGYGIVDQAFQFTNLGQDLYERRDGPEAMHDRFARHILLHLHGHKILEIVKDLEATGKRPLNARVKRELRDHYNFHIDDTSNHWSQMRAWLAKAGVVNTGSPVYDIDDEKVADLIGLRQDDVVDLEHLTPEQIAFLRALTIVDPDTPVENTAIRRVAEQALGVDIDQSNISRRVLEPLAEAGYLEWHHRDGAPNTVAMTVEFNADVLAPILDDVSERVGVPRAALRKSFSDLEEGIARAPDRETSAKHLETVAVKIGRELGHDFLGWYTRATDTDTDGVAVVFDEVETAFLRWQIHLPDVGQPIRSEHVTQGVGVADLLGSDTIVLISRHGVRQEARRVAAQTMRRSSLSIAVLNFDDLSILDESGVLYDRLADESERIQRVKRLEDADLFTRNEAKMIEISDISGVDIEIETDSEPGSVPLSEFGVDAGDE